MLDLQQAADLQTLVYFLSEVARGPVSRATAALDGSGVREWRFGWREPLDGGARVEITATVERDGSMSFAVREVAPPADLEPFATTTGSPLGLPWGCPPGQVRRAIELAKERLLALVALEATPAG